MTNSHSNLKNLKYNQTKILISILTAFSEKGAKLKQQMGDIKSKFMNKINSLIKIALGWKAAAFLLCFCQLLDLFQANFNK